MTAALDLMFYILFTPVCVSMMDKIMLTGENTMKANDAVNRIMNIVGGKAPERAGCARRNRRNTALNLKM